MSDSKQDPYKPPKQLWLAPWCRECKGAHDWCQHQVFDPCSVCGREAVRYVIAEPQP
jgi:hypothetical protein